MHSKWRIYLELLHIRQQKIETINFSISKLFCLKSFSYFYHQLWHVFFKCIELLPITILKYIIILVLSYGNMADHWLMVVEYSKSKRVHGDAGHNRIGCGS